MKTERLRFNQRGASLVLVIVCMMFVGIIAAAILTITVGNVNTAQTVSKSSSNFYGTEEFVDDLKIYIQKFANQAATQAYADQLKYIAIHGTPDEEQYQTDFKEHLFQVLRENWSDIRDSSKSTFANGATVIADISIDDFDSAYDKNTNTIKNIKITFKDNGSVHADFKDLETTITTDMVIDSIMPELNWSNGQRTFDYNVNKYIIISNEDVDMSNAANATVAGNIYAKGDIKFTNMKLFAQNVISGNDVIISTNGTAKFQFKGFGDAESGLDFSKKLDLVKNVSTNTKLDASDDGNLWCRNMDINAGGMLLGKTGHLYLSDDLSLDGNTSSFEVLSGSGESSSIIAFSEGSSTYGEDTATVLSDAHTKSGAIIVNGSAATLDLSNLQTLYLAGTAYTEVPSIPGYTLDNFNAYFVQGESVTFKSLQSVYLIAGEKLGTVGHNPMSLNEFKAWAGADGTTGTLASGATHPTGVDAGTGNFYKYKIVEYAKNDTANTYVYVFWNFGTAADAVAYAQDVYNKNLFDQRMEMFSGTIILPEEDSTVVTKGNRIEKFSTMTSEDGFDAGTTWSSSDAANACEEAKADYASLKSTLSKSSTSTGDLFTKLFGSSLSNYAAGEKYTYVLEPEDQKQTHANTTVTDDLIIGKLYLESAYTVGTGDDTVSYSSGGCISDGDAKDTSESTDYYLVLAKNGSKIEIDSAHGFSSIKKYVVVTSGDVDVNANFQGIIFAEGTVKVNGNCSMTCLGNYIRKKDGETEFVSEFAALLDYVKDNDSKTIGTGIEEDYNWNTVLRKIFGVAAGASGIGEAIQDNDNSTVRTNNWFMN